MTAESIALTDKEFLNRLCGDIERFEGMGFGKGEIKRMITSLNYVRDWARFPSWIRVERTLPKGYKLTDGKRYHVNGGSKADAQTCYFVPVGDDLYIRDGFLIEVSGGKKRLMFTVVESYRDWSATAVRTGICGTNTAPFFESSLFDFYRSEGLRITDNAAAMRSAT